MHHLAFLASLLPLAAGHGFIASPPARRPGNAFKTACGEQPFYQQSSDINGNVQGIQQVVGADKTDACNLWLCKGFVLEDNTDKVQSFSLGQTIDFKINIAAPHTGYANVSVVKTSTNTMIGTPLIEFDNYASNAGVSANNSAFSVTLPSSLGSDCTTAGDCVLQWFWNAPDIDQTYEACVDFTVSGGGSGSAPSSAVSSAAPATSQAAATSTAVAATTTSADATVPTATTTPVPDETGDDECPADEDDSEDGDGEEEGDDDECPADDGEGDEDEGAGEDDECPADEGEDDETDVPAATSSAAAAPAPTAADVGSSASTVTQVVTSTVTTERVVTVTAAATACN